MKEEMCRARKKLVLRVVIALGRCFCLSAFKFCPRPKLKKCNRYWPTSFFNRLVWRRRCAEHKQKLVLQVGIAIRRWFCLWEMCRAGNKLAFHMGKALGRWFCLLAFKFCPHPKLKRSNRHWPTSCFDRLVWRRRCAVRKNWCSAWE